MICHSCRSVCPGCELCGFCIDCHGECGVKEYIENRILWVFGIAFLFLCWWCACNMFYSGSVIIRNRLETNGQSIYQLEKRVTELEVNTKKQKESNK